MHSDGYPSHHLPLLLAAHQYTFGKDTEALTRYLIDDAPEGWSSLGTDLLVHAPGFLRDTLPRGHHEPGRRYPERSPGERLVFTEQTASRLDWAYVLHPEGIEVIGAPGSARGPIVAWDTDPCVRFRDTTSLWKPGRPIPGTTPPQATTRSTAPAQPPPVSASAPRPRAH
ncbi:hypothetical protein [Streptomyces venezuelae]|uniref:hypothetical protein n=1 Tax=Streptomyces venezuelae TaxID=54571 RepID=UPI001689E8CD|nr:hypothetical protein [Streptomyces venezuelae]